MKSSWLTAAIALAVPLEAAAGEPVGRKAPHGFLEMTVAGVMPTDQGQAVILTDDEKKSFLPIWIGGTEALSIQLRLERRRFERPLTHDLLDAVLKELGGELIKVHIDDLKSSTFTATLFLKRGDKIIELDARPSDSIALAIGAKVPIYVAKRVVDSAGMKADEKAKLPGPDAPPLTKPSNQNIHTL